jgi:hypothetical protein
MSRCKQVFVHIIFYASLLASLEYSTVGSSKFGYLLYISKIELFQHGQEDDDVPSIKFEYDRELCQLHGT